MSFAQRRFDDGGASGGFASTVWDSSIVLQYVEKHRGSFANEKVLRAGRGVRGGERHAGQGWVREGRRDGLTGEPSAAEENMERNCGGGGNGRGGGREVGGEALTWGADAAVALGETFDVVVAADCMYIAEAASDLVDTLAALVPAEANRRGRSLPPALIAWQNRQAEDEFLAACDEAKSGRRGR